MKEYVSQTTAAMKMGKKHFQIDQSSGCYEEKTFHWVIPC